MTFKLPNDFCHYQADVAGQKTITNKEVFHVGPISNPLEEETTFSLGKIVSSISANVSLGLIPLTHKALSKMISKFILPALNFTEEEKLFFQMKKKYFLRGMSEKAQEFDLHMENGVVVNGMGIFLNKEAKKEFLEGIANNQQWVIHFNGNMQTYENSLYDLRDKGKDFGVNMLCFNYQGVVDSKGCVVTKEDLIADGMACVKYLLSKGVPEENILIDGLSLGGGVGTQVASRYEKIGLINFCSFGAISKIAAAHAGFVAGKILRAIGWELDSVEAYEKIKAPKLIVFHKRDGVIPYEFCAYKMIKERIKQQNPESFVFCEGKLKTRLKEEFKPARVKLMREFPKPTVEAHVYEFHKDPAYPQIRDFVKTFFAKTA